MLIKLRRLPFSNHFWTYCMAWIQVWIDQTNLQVLVLGRRQVPFQSMVLGLTFVIATLCDFLVPSVGRSPTWPTFCDRWCRDQASRDGNDRPHWLAVTNGRSNEPQIYLPSSQNRNLCSWSNSFSSYLMICRRYKGDEVYENPDRILIFFNVILLFEMTYPSDRESASAILDAIFWISLLVFHWSIGIISRALEGNQHLLNYPGAQHRALFGRQSFLTGGCKHIAYLILIKWTPTINPNRNVAASFSVFWLNVSPFGAVQNNI